MKPENYIEIARKYIKKCEGKCQHVSLLLIRNKILSVGVNNYIKTHPFAHHNNYRYSHIHSELDCIRRFPWRQHDMKRASLVNLRFARATDGLLLSRPCHNCLNLIAAFNIKEVVFSTPTGFEKL